MTKHYASHKAWRLANPEMRQAGKKRNYAKSRKTAVNCRKRWSFNEDLKIMAADKLADSVLAVELGRSTQAIEQRRHKLKFGLPS